MGILLALVRIFPTDTHYWVHTGFTTGMAVIFTGLIVLLPRWLPGMPPAFCFLGWLMITVLVVVVVLFATSYSNLTAMELTGGVVFFAWIHLFVVNVAALQRGAVHDGRAESAGAAAVSRYPSPSAHPDLVRGS